MSNYRGDFATGATVRLMWNTNGQDGASITRGTDGSIRIYRDASDVQRASASGISDTEDFDGLTGVHHLLIDLSDDADAGFYAAGHDYLVVVVGAVVNSKTVNACIGEFSIENRVGIADAMFKRDLDNVEATAAVHSLATACLKLVSRFKATTGETFRTDGTTVHATQTPTTSSSAVPVVELGVAT